MKKIKEFNFENARRITPEEVESARHAIKALTGKLPRRRRGALPKPPGEKYQPIALRVHPDVMKWARKQAEKRGVGYQTVINEALLKAAVRKEAVVEKRARAA